MHIISFGLNHKSAPLILRERFAFYKNELPSALSVLRGSFGIEECLILSTCNRTEIYAASHDVSTALNSIRQFFLKTKEINADNYKDNFYLHIDSGCLYHLCHVAAGLDSLVVGETQIFGQLKEAYVIARENFTLARILHPVFQRAFFVAKKIRSNFSIGEGQVSIGSAAVALAKEKLGTLAEKQVLAIGTGEVSRLVLNYLREEKAAALIANRTYQKAKVLASTFGGTPILFNRIFDYLESADIVIASTSAPHYLLTADNAAAVLSGRKKPLIILDLAVPRNIDPALADIAGLHLYNIDDLGCIAEGNLKKRQEELLLCQEMIKREADKFIRKIFLQHKELVNA